MSIVLVLVSGIAVSAQGILGTWYNAEKDAKVKIYQSGDKYYGKIVWLKNPNDADGNPKKDDKNPDKKLAQRPKMGLILLKGFVKESEKEYEDGTIYDPRSGKTYSCVITVKSSTELSIRGYIGISLIGKTTTWTKAD